MENQMIEAIKAKLEAAKENHRRGITFRNAHAVIENGPDSTDYVLAVFVEATEHYDGRSRFLAETRAEAMQNELGYLGYGYHVIEVEV